jgi:2-iminobutanoate/2-iminopropanoate deaminase
VTVTERVVVSTDQAAGPFGGAPYSQAIVSNGFVFTAGQIGARADGSGLAGETIEEQTEQAIGNVKAILEAAGSDLGRVVKATCFLSDLANFPAFNEVYRRHFPSSFPARSTVGVSLPPGVLVEIEVVAAVG